MDWTWEWRSIQWKVKSLKKIGEESTKRRNYIGESDVASLRTGRSSETPLKKLKKLKKLKMINFSSSIHLKMKAITSLDKLCANLVRNWIFHRTENEAVYRGYVTGQSWSAILDSSSLIPNNWQSLIIKSQFLSLSRIQSNTFEGMLKGFLAQHRLDEDEWTDVRNGPHW